jgi:hypothetical protein
MKLTTPKPRRNILKLLPELAKQAKTTVRLHPRRGEVRDPAASKIGGTFLWPADTPWPDSAAEEAKSYYKHLNRAWPVPRGAKVPLVPVLQLRADEFAEIEFLPGTDLFQLMWCPLVHGEPIWLAKPFVFWHDMKSIRKTRQQMPKFDYADPDYIPHRCSVNPERVVEYPFIGELTDKQRTALDEWDVIELLDEDIEEPSTLYEWECSVCPSIKVGGHVFWIQTPEIPSCDCGRPMDHLLTLTDDEFDGGTYRRWCPKEAAQRWRDDEIITPAFGNLGSSNQYIFICRECEGWPIKSVCQCS